MKVAVFGVANWDNEEQARELAPTLIEWEQRIRAFIPQCTELFLTTGSYSPPEFSPIDVPVYQTEMYRSLPYGVKNSYFHYGFKTGVWKKLLDNDFDVLIHCQATRFIGRDIGDEIQQFMDSSDVIMAPRFASTVGTSIDVGFMCMKKPAVLYYGATGHRQSFEQHPTTINCEEEAFIMFSDRWNNPWPGMLTTKQLDISSTAGTSFSAEQSCFTITDKEYFCTFPIIANGKHVQDDFLEAWRAANPLPPIIE